jgi:hypothetical protein
MPRRANAARVFSLHRDAGGGAGEWPTPGGRAWAIQLLLVSPPVVEDLQAVDDDRRRPAPEAGWVTMSIRHRPALEQSGSLESGGPSAGHVSSSGPTSQWTLLWLTSRSGVDALS